MKTENARMDRNLAMAGVRLGSLTSQESPSLCDENEFIVSMEAFENEPVPSNRAREQAARLYHGYGQWLASRTRFSEARTYQRKSLRLSPGNAESWDCLARIDRALFDETGIGHFQTEGDGAARNAARLRENMLRKGADGARFAWDAKVS